MLADGEEGWISVQLVEVGGEVRSIPVAAVIPPTPTSSAPPRPLPIARATCSVLPKTESETTSIFMNILRSGFKTAFVARMSDIYSRKAEVQNRRRRSQSYVEDEFCADNTARGDCSRS